jgi:hypothetical protein
VNSNQIMVHQAVSMPPAPETLPRRSTIELHIETIGSMDKKSAEPNQHLTRSLYAKELA